MTDTPNIAMAGALIAGLSSSAHCFGMCGGMAGALGMHARSVARAGHNLVATAALYQLGRLSGYMALGALFGLLGMALSMSLNLGRISNVMRIVSGALLVLIGIRVLFRFNVLASFERVGARVWRRIQPLAGRANGNAFARPLLLGLMWGWLPCGMVYSMLMLAATSGSASNGSAVMLAFGIGTLPSMLTSTLAGSSVQRLLAQRTSRIATGVLLTAFGAWMFVSSLLALGHEHQHIA